MSGAIVAITCSNVPRVLNRWEIAPLPVSKCSPRHRHLGKKVFINPLSIVTIWTGPVSENREPKLTYIGLLAAIGTHGTSNSNTFIVTERSLDEVWKRINKGLR